MDAATKLTETAATMGSPLQTLMAMKARRAIRPELPQLQPQHEAGVFVRTRWGLTRIGSNW
jgi:hypothetical protein